MNTKKNNYQIRPVLSAINKPEYTFLNGLK